MSALAAFRSLGWFSKNVARSSLLTLEPIAQNGYFRPKADITCVLPGANTAAISNITSSLDGMILRRSFNLCYVHKSGH